MSLSRVTGLVLGLVMLPLLVTCNEESNDGSILGESDSYGLEKFTVYKQPSCDYCKKWMFRLEEAGIESTDWYLTDLNAIKVRYQIEPHYQCRHIAVLSQGYVFEGHIPTRFIRAFLANPPTVQVLVKKDGSSEVFASVESATQQDQREAQS